MKMRKLLFAIMTVGTVMMFNACTEESKPCDGVTCSSHGTPVESVGICSCDCDPGYSGDDCECPTCLNGGNCLSGACDCATGYEGDSCQIVSRDKFIGGSNNNFLVTDSPCTSAPYNVTITTSSAGIDKIIIVDFGKFLCNGDAPDVIASVSGDSLTIASQTFCTGNAITMSGSGVISGNSITITINYTTANAGNSFTCTAVLVRQ